MSHTQYFVGIARDGVKAIVDNAQVNIRAPEVYRVLMQNLFANQGSELLTSLIQRLDQRTQGQWRVNSGIPQEHLLAFLREWTSEALDHVQKALVSAQQQNGFQQQPGMTNGYGTSGPVGYAPPYVASPTNGMYASAGAPPPAPPGPFFSNGGPVLEVAPAPADFPTDYELGRQPMFELHQAPTAELFLPPNGVVGVSKYFVGEFEKTRLLSAELTLKVAQNTPADAGHLVFHKAPQEVIRGSFVDVILYHELFHIPIGYPEFIALIEAVWSAYQKDNNWRTALKVLSGRTRSEWDIMDKALCRLINPSINRRMRSSDDPRALILGIENLDDLSVMDDRNANFAIAKHSKYWPTFNKIVEAAVNDLFDPDNVVKPTDVNFGDFVHCKAISFWSDGHSKYDYGTFPERVDQQQFITKMMAANTVVRVPKAAVLTNALDPRLIAKIQAGAPADQTPVHSVNTVGTALLNKVKYLERAEVDAVLCLEQTGWRPLGQLKLGRTLDDDLLLLS